MRKAKKIWLEYNIRKESKPYKKRAEIEFCGKEELTTS